MKENSQMGSNMPLNTDVILQQEPFNLTNPTQRAEFIHLAQELNVTLDDFLLGKVYKKECLTNPEPYTEAELAEIEGDIKTIYARTFAGRVPNVVSKKYTFTLGAPLTGKSTFMEAKLVDSSKVYVDPDRQSLRFMDSYHKLAQTNPKVAYETYRDASNYICNLLMVWAVYKQFSIVHGTTGTNPRMANSILPALKKLGYKIDAHVIFAPTESRKAAGIFRNEHQKFYQSTPADEKGKVAPVFARIKDAIIPYADKADFYWNKGTFWLNTTPDQNRASWCKFASLDKANSPFIIADHRFPEVQNLLENQIIEELSNTDDREQTIGMIRPWFTRPQPGLRDYLPAFNNRNAVLLAGATFAALAVAATAVNSNRASNNPINRPN